MSFPVFGLVFATGFLAGFLMSIGLGLKVATGRWIPFPAYRPQPRDSRGRFTKAD